MLTMTDAVKASIERCNAWATANALDATHPRFTHVVTLKAELGFGMHIFSDSFMIDDPEDAAFFWVMSEHEGYHVFAKDEWHEREYTHYKSDVVLQDAKIFAKELLEDHKQIDELRAWLRENDMSGLECSQTVLLEKVLVSAANHGIQLARVITEAPVVQVDNDAAVRIVGKLSSAINQSLELLATLPAHKPHPAPKRVRPGKTSKPARSKGQKTRRQ